LLSRLFALVVLLALIGGGLYYWKLEGRGLLPPEALGEVAPGLRDSATTGAVKGAFRLNRHLKPHRIGVKTEEGVVTLRGEVPREELRDLAGDVAAAVPSVRQVVNHVRVAPETAPAPAASERTLGESLDDETLELRVRLAFSLNRDLEGTDIQVSAFRREIVLAGRVATEAQQRLAVRIARDTPGVVSVTDRLLSMGGAKAGGPADVERALAENRHLTGYAIEVKEETGRLVLAGRVGTGAEKDLAELLARNATQLQIENRLEIVPAESQN
jgi:osmotically-inducible protein OsmY